MVRRALRFGVMVGAGIWMPACGARTADPRDRAWVPETVGDAVIVARVGDVPIFDADVRAQMAVRGGSRERALDEIVEFHLLAEKARAAGFWDESGRESVPKELWVQRLLEREFEPTARKQDVPETEVRRAYERAIDTFVHPRLVKVAVLFIPTGPRAKEPDRSAARQTAKDLSAALRVYTDQDAGIYQAIALEEAWQRRGVQFKEVIQGPDRPLSAAVGSEVVRLKKPGDSTPVLEDQAGLYIACYTSEQPAQNLSLDDVKERLRDELYPTWRKQHFNLFASLLRSRHQVELTALAADQFR